MISKEGREELGKIYGHNRDANHKTRIYARSAAGFLATLAVVDALIIPENGTLYASLTAAAAAETLATAEAIIKITERKIEDPILRDVMRNEEE